MTTQNISARLTIFEGCDGSGKSTAAKAFAEKTGARYIHFGPLPKVSKGLARMYVEAMLPALMGYQDVVFDRSWLSEVPYGSAMRDGADRLGDASRRMLERIALRCQSTVIHCQPPWEVIESSYRARKGEEYLNSIDKLRHVYEIYASSKTALDGFSYDYTTQPEFYTPGRLDTRRSEPHYLRHATAGNMFANVALVGEKFAERKDQDAWYQTPFVSFCGLGCSQWLAKQLDGGGIPENTLFWVNADQHLPAVLSGKPRHIIALGVEASSSLSAVGIAHSLVPHPQSWRRFNHNQPYPLIDTIKELIDDCKICE